MAASLFHSHERQSSRTRQIPSEADGLFAALSTVGSGVDLKPALEPKVDATPATHTPLTPTEAIGPTTALTTIQTILEMERRYPRVDVTLVCNCVS